MRLLRKLILIILLTLLSVCSWGQGAKRIYQAELLGRIPLGTAPGEVDHQFILGTADVPSYPVTFANNIYIMDNANGRLNLYDRNLIFVGEIHSENKLFFASSYDFSITKDGDIFGFYAYGAYRIKNNGTIVYQIGREGIPEHVIWNGRYWTYEDNIIFLDQPDGGDYHVIDGQGRFLEDDEIAELGEEMKKTSLLRQESPRMREAIDMFLEENNLILDGNRDFLLTSWRGVQYRQFYKLITEYSDRPIENKVPDAAYSDQGGGLNGVDAHGNTWWSIVNIKYGERYDYIISPRGEVLDYFTITPEGRIWEGEYQRTFSYSYAADGVFYSIVYNNAYNTYDLYRVAGDWLKYSEKRPTAFEIESKKVYSITSLSASSTLTEPFDKNAYHAVKVLDGKLDSAWMEAADGPGIGEWWEMSLDRSVTVDEIRIGPGYLGAPWWIQNNRIRQIDLILDDRKTIRNFADAMEIQSITFSSPVTFTKMRIVIDEVYPTTHWDDTPLAEAELWYQGEKIEIDLGEHAEYLKVDAGS